MPKLCIYITGHGFGHATRCQALAEYLLNYQADCWEIFIRTCAPERIFNWLLGPRCHYHFVELDRGLPQRDAYQIDFEAALDFWRYLLSPRRQAQIIDEEATFLTENKCDVVLADIVPLACAAGKKARLPVVVMSNFLWDWILTGLVERCSGLASVVDELKQLYSLADLFLKLPMSHETSTIKNQLEVGWLGRQAKRPAAEIKAELGLKITQRLALISFGGFGLNEINLDKIAECAGWLAAWEKEIESPSSTIISLAKRKIFFPDLINAADLILTKPGFSIVAESVMHKKFIGYVPRHDYPENGPLVSFLKTNWPSMELAGEDLLDGNWVKAMQTAEHIADNAFPKLNLNGAEEIRLCLKKILGD